MSMPYNQDNFAYVLPGGQITLRAQFQTYAWSGLEQPVSGVQVTIALSNGGPPVYGPTADGIITVDAATCTLNWQPPATTPAGDYLVTDAVLGAVRPAEPGLPRTGAAARRARPGRRGRGCHVRLGPGRQGKTARFSAWKPSAPRLRQERSRRRSASSPVASSGQPRTRSPDGRERPGRSLPARAGIEPSAAPTPRSLRHAVPRIRAIHAQQLAISVGPAFSGPSPSKYWRRSHGQVTLPSCAAWSTPLLVRARRGTSLGRICACARWAAVEATMARSSHGNERGSNQRTRYTASHARQR